MQIVVPAVSWGVCSRVRDRRTTARAAFFALSRPESDKIASAWLTSVPEILKPPVAGQTRNLRDRSEYPSAALSGARTRCNSTAALGDFAGRTVRPLNGTIPGDLPRICPGLDRLDPHSGSGRAV